MSRDKIVDEVRAIRRAVCSEFRNDVDRLFEQLLEVEREYGGRLGVFAGVTREAAARVAASWGEQAPRTDGAIVDEVRAIRKKLASRKP